MASWQSYIDSLMSTNLLNFAAIVGNADGKIYASTKDFKLTVHQASHTNEKNEKKEFIVDEWNQLKDIMTPGKLDLTKGYYMNGKKYIILNIEENKAYLKCEHGGACIVKTNKTFVIGGFTSADDAKKNGGVTNSIIEDFAEQLMKANY